MESRATLLQAAPPELRLTFVGELKATRIER